MPIMGIRTTLNNKTEVPSNFFDENDAEVPIWDVGHSWTYDVTIFGGIPNYLTVDGVDERINSTIIVTETLLELGISPEILSFDSTAENMENINYLYLLNFQIITMLNYHLIFVMSLMIINN